MDLDPTTFALQILNFAVLVWLLGRFLYRPVLAALEQRRAELEAKRREAEEALARARALEAEYRGRLAAWEEEKARLRRALGEELEAERARRMAALGEELEREREQARRAAEEALREERRDLERRAVEQATAFLARLLEPFAQPAVERGLVELFIAWLEQLPAERREELRKGYRAGRLQLLTAFPLPEDLRRRLAELLAGDSEAPLPHRCDPTLKAGIVLEDGGARYAATLQDELKLFAELGRERED
ncbi:MAG: hypothetical protein KatS3mg124_0048 [Porticoccaceae bacterium]|nr:MAG: hypothetical protein KatS3mg124_0048 [Porticoccaceae bacterium]